MSLNSNSQQQPPAAKPTIPSAKSTAVPSAVKPPAIAPAAGGEGPAPGLPRLPEFDPKVLEKLSTPVSKATFVDRWLTRRIDWQQSAA